MKNIIFIIAFLFSASLFAQRELPAVTNADDGKYLKYMIGTGWTMGTGTTGITGTGLANRVAYWDGIGSIAYDDDFQWNQSTNVLSIQGAAPIIEVYRASSGAAYFQLRNTSNTWNWYVNGSSAGMEPQVADGNFTIRSLANTPQFQMTTNATNSSSRFDVVGRGNFGFTVGGTQKGWVNIASNTTSIPSLSLDTSGALVSTPQAGYMEAVGQRLYYTNSSGRHTIAYTYEIPSVAGYFTSGANTVTSNTTLNGAFDWRMGNTTTLDTVQIKANRIVLDAPITSVQTITASNLLDGVWTPTLTNTTNVGASTPYECSYMRVGNTVTVSGRVDIDATATGTTVLEMSLPIASNFSATNKAGGTAASSINTVIPIYAEVTNDRLYFIYTASVTTNESFHFSATYRIE
jgi:hypothetical protein